MYKSAASGDTTYFLFCFKSTALAKCLCFHYLRYKGFQKAHVTWSPALNSACIRVKMAQVLFETFELATSAKEALDGGIRLASVSFDWTNAFHRWQVLALPHLKNYYSHAREIIKFSTLAFSLRFTGILWVLWGQHFRRLHPSIGSAQWRVYHRLQRVAATVQLISRIYHQVRWSYLQEGREFYRQHW